MYLGINPHKDVPMDTLYAKLRIQEVMVPLGTKRLRWYGHVSRATSCINSIINMDVPREAKEDMV